MFTDNLLRDIKIGLRVLVKETDLLRAGRGRPGPWDQWRHHDVQRGQRRDASRFLVSERRPHGQPQLHRSLDRQLLRGQRPGVGDGLRRAAAAAEVVRRAHRLSERLDRQRHGQRPSAAVYRRLRDRPVPPDPRGVAADGPRLHARRQRVGRRQGGDHRLRHLAARLRRRRRHRRQGRADQRQGGHRRRRDAARVRVPDQRRDLAAALQRVPAEAAQRSGRDQSRR